MSTLKVDQWLNSDGTENYKCRAWVNFNGIGTVAIRASGNVSSITDNGTGDYTVNFTTAMVDADYATCLVFGVNTNSGLSTPSIASQVAGSARVNAYQGYSGSPGFYDASVICVAIFR